MERESKKGIENRIRNLDDKKNRVCVYIIITLVGNGEISMIFKMIGRNIAIVTQVWLKVPI